jgi:hypothetical protein
MHPRGLNIFYTQIIQSLRTYASDPTSHTTLARLRLPAPSVGAYVPWVQACYYALDYLGSMGKMNQSPLDFMKLISFLMNRIPQ